MADVDRDLLAPGRVRGVFFDLAGTLIGVRQGIGRQYADIAAQFGVHVNASELDRAFPEAFRSAGRMVFPRPDAAEAASLEKEFWRGIVGAVFARVGVGPQFGDGQFDRYFNRLFDHFATAPAWEVYGDVLLTLEQLAARGVVLGLITNFDYRVFKVVDALGLGRYIRSVTIPALAGAAKPERAIFEYALGRHGLRPDEAAQVGDSFEDDVEGAQAAGMRAVLLDRAARHPRRDVPTISSLEELPRVLGLS